jgi:hypothetical protein
VGAFLLPTEKIERENIMANPSALTGKTQTNLFFEYSGDDGLIVTPKQTININESITWTYGTGASQFQLLFQDSRSTDATGETLSFFDGGLTDVFGNTLTMANLKLLYVKNTHATLILELMGNASLDLLILSGTTDAYEIPPGGHKLWIAPTAAGIDMSTNKNLFIAATTAGTITYDIVAAGLD